VAAAGNDLWWTVVGWLLASPLLRQHRFLSAPINKTQLRLISSNNAVLRLQNMPYAHSREKCPLRLTYQPQAINTFLS
jgi:hypothetical protein